MIKAWLFPVLAAFCLASCQAVVDRMADDIADQVSEQVVDQVNTAVAAQVGTAVAELSAAMSQDVSLSQPASDDSAEEEIAQVTRVIDGDTIDVLIDGKTARIRYVQINTPERDQPCFRESTQANAELVAGKTVRLVPSKRLIDPFDRLLRYVYVGDIMVERVLVEEGFAEVVLYPPNDAHYEEFVRLEAEAAAAGRGCHPTGIFDDGSTTR
ncbi:MAG: thermonuclease family protein [Chloroflexi bacterium]|nr:thermonuclease family protein [Chloroflexota bacterium]